MSEINDYKKSAVIESIKTNFKLINLTIVLIVFTLFLIITKFVHPILSYLPTYSIAIMLAITAILVSLGFYLANLSSRSAIKKLNDYSAQVGKMVDSMEYEITQRKIMEKDLLAMSLTDDLTGLNNRRGFLSLAAQYLKLVNRQKINTFLFYADVDRFKHINDTYGHSEGDKVLVDIANILKKSFRDSDIIARIGGDEFVVLPIGFNEFDPEIIHKRIRENFKLLNYEYNRKYTVSISVGIAHYNAKKPCSIEELLDIADKLMYKDKKAKGLPHPLPDLPQL
jgi:diguanylate cyclase (GGDEF)-like protein